MEKTLKQIADELGIDKQKLYRFVVKHGISEIYQKNNMKYYDESAQLIIHQAFIKKDDRNDELDKDTIIEILKKQAETLKNELDSRNKQIEFVQNELNIRNKQYEWLQAEIEIRNEKNDSLTEKLFALTDFTQELHKEYTALQKLSDGNKESIFKRMFKKKK